MPDSHLADGLDTIEKNHGALLTLCQRLEDLADSLPFSVDETLCREVAGDIVPLLSQAQAVEEDMLYPALTARAGSCFSALMIERLKGEHRCDRNGAEEIALTLQAMLAGRCRLSFETVGYMLRGFFECVRRHIASERELINSLCQPTLHS